MQRLQRENEELANRNRKLGQRVSDLGVLGPSLSPRSLKRERRGDGAAQGPGREVGAAKRLKAAGTGV